VTTLLTFQECSLFIREQVKKSMKFIKTQIYFLAIVILLISCSEEELPPQQQSPPSSAKSILDLDVTIFNVDGEEKQSPAKIVGRDIIVDIPLYMDTDEIQITLSASPRASSAGSKSISFYRSRGRGW